MAHGVCGVASHQERPAHFAKDSSEASLFLTRHPYLLLLLLYILYARVTSAIKTPHTAAYHDTLLCWWMRRGAGGSVSQSRGAVSRICASSKMRKINKEARLTTPWAILTE